VSSILPLGEGKCTEALEEVCNAGVSALFQGVLGNLTLERDLKCAHNQSGAVMWGECRTAYKADPTISWGSHLPTGAFPEMHVSRPESASVGLRAGRDPEKSCRGGILTTSSAGSLASMFTRGGAMDRDTEQVREPA
jgi:hypothetical protein